MLVLNGKYNSAKVFIGRMLSLLMKNDCKRRN